MLRFPSKLDKTLLLSLLLGLIFSVYGIHWGRVEDWNSDQMAFRPIFQEGKLPFTPDTFYKPPFHTYFNFALSEVPFYAIRKVLHLSRESIFPLMLLWSRMLVVFLFMGSIYLVFKITQRFFGLFAARVITIVFSTSAGFIAFSHFLTVDIPVMFWMLVAFYFAQNVFLGGAVGDYTLAGFFTGIATATKYNGLGVGIAIVTAHALSINHLTWSKILIDKKLILGLFMVAIGFFVGNPFAILDYSRFVSDFMYNNLVTPIYSGEVGGHGYWVFLLRIQEIIGLPSFLIFSTAFLFAFYVLFATRGPTTEKRALLLLLSVLLLYYIKIGSFPRLPARFVMPVVPFMLIMSGPFWCRVQSMRILLKGIMIALIGYNLISSYSVGRRFLGDPRMMAQVWVKDNIPNHSSIELSSYTPDWNRLPGVTLEEKQMPVIYGRGRLLGPLIKDNPWGGDLLAEIKKENEEEKWYSRVELMNRQPDYIAIDSLYYDRFMNDKVGDLYPSIKQFFEALLKQEYPYRIVFDQESAPVPVWIYPQEIDFLKNRITIFQRTASMAPR
jgi:hypothetical protein